MLSQFHVSYKQNTSEVKEASSSAHPQQCSTQQSWSHMDLPVPKTPLTGHQSLWKNDLIYTDNSLENINQSNV